MKYGTQIETICVADTVRKMPPASSRSESKCLLNNILHSILIKSSKQMCDATKTLFLVKQTQLFANFIIWITHRRQRWYQLNWITQKNILFKRKKIMTYSTVNYYFYFQVDCQRNEKNKFTWYRSVLLITWCDWTEIWIVRELTLD